MIVAPLYLSLILKTLWQIGESEKGWQEAELGDLYSSMEELAIRKLQKRVLHGLNWTSPPIFTNRPMQRLNETVLPFGAFHTNISIVFSQATDSDDKELFVFNISSQDRLRLDEMDNISLRFSLRPLRQYFLKRGLSASLTSKRAKAIIQRLNKKAMKVRGRLRRCNETAAEISGEDLACNLKKTRGSDNGHGMISVDSSTGLFSLTDNNQLQESMVKIVARVVNPHTGRKRKFATMKCTVNKKQTLSFTMLTHLFKKCISSENHSLTIQLVCRNCFYLAHLEGVYKKLSRRKLHRKSRRLNPNRPHLIIRYRNNSTGSFNLYNGRTDFYRQFIT